MSTLNASLLNEDTTAAIAAFAKSQKVSLAACLKAASIALALQPFAEGIAVSGEASPEAKGASKANRKPSATGTRQAGNKSLEFRAAIVKSIPELKGKRYTFGALAKQFGIDQPNAINNLKYLQRNKQVKYKIVGTAIKAASQRGKAPALIEFF